jgi:hypothetical protein
LPADATAEEIVDIEASLQGKPEVKLDYDWIGERPADQPAYKSGAPRPKQVADQLNRPVKEIENTRAALAEAQLYLKEWQGQRMTTSG